MSESKEYRCGVCGQEGKLEPYGIVLCHEHAVLNRRLRSLEAKWQGQETDLTGRRSMGPRDDHDGGYKRRFDVVPEHDLEQVSRDVTVTFEQVPLWGAEALFERVHADLGRPDIEDMEVKLIVKYSLLDEGKYEKLLSLRHRWALGFEFETTKTRLYPPQRPTVVKGEVEQEREGQE